ncbi:MAG TPA: methyltransferase domain-containing protein [Solirubrobacterales bacterium]|nr:methyltransferase domain-containing protein [Solirubrobacterales bacterium]
MSTRNFLSPLARLFSPTSPLTARGRARRRFNCEKQSEWDGRAETAVALLVDLCNEWLPEPRRGAEIADFGAGNERLRPLLDSQLGGEIQYHPYDLHPQLPTTERLDVSQGLPDQSFDLALCLGLLEYLPSVPTLARDLRAHCRFALVSYVTSDSPVAIPYDDRLQHGWTSHLKGEELEASYREAGFRMLGSGTSDGEATTLWLWAAGAQYSY